MNRFAFTSAITLLLSACGVPSPAEMAKDQTLLAKANQNCYDLRIRGKDTNTEECRNAAAAVQILRQKIYDDVRGSGRF